MPIIIERLGSLKGQNETHQYQVRVNRDVKAYFLHKYSDGLAACILKASEAVKGESNENTKI